MCVFVLLTFKIAGCHANLYFWLCLGKSDELVTVGLCSHVAIMSWSLTVITTLLNGRVVTNSSLFPLLPVVSQQEGRPTVDMDHHTCPVVYSHRAVFLRIHALSKAESDSTVSYMDPLPAFTLPA